MKKWVRNGVEVTYDKGSCGAADGAANADVKEHLQGGTFVWYKNPVQSVIHDEGHLEHVQVFWRPNKVDGVLLEGEEEEAPVAAEAQTAAAAGAVRGGPSSAGAGTSTAHSADAVGEAMDISAEGGYRTQDVTAEEVTQSSFLRRGLQPRPLQAPWTPSQEYHEAI